MHLTHTSLTYTYIHIMPILPYIPLCYTFFSSTHPLTGKILHTFVLSSPIANQPERENTPGDLDRHGFQLQGDDARGTQDVCILAQIHYGSGHQAVTTPGPDLQMWVLVKVEWMQAINVKSVQHDFNALCRVVTSCMQVVHLMKYVGDICYEVIAARPSFGTLDFSILVQVHYNANYQAVTTPGSDLQMWLLVKVECMQVIYVRSMYLFRLPSRDPLTRSCTDFKNKTTILLIVPTRDSQRE